MNPNMLAGILDLVVRVSGERSAAGLANVLSHLRNRFFDLGTTVIWMDRLALALNRTWTALGETIGATRVGEQARDFYNFAQMLNLGVEEFQAFTIVAGQFDAKIRDVVDAFMQMEDAKASFMAGDKAITKTLKGSGLTTKSFIGKDSIESFRIISEAVAKLPDNQRLQALKNFFGEEGSRQLGPLSTQGWDALVMRMQEARDLGAVMSKEQIDAARQYNYLMNRVSMVFTAVGNNFARIFMPALEHVGAWLVKIGSRFAKYFNRNGETFGDQVARLVDMVLAKLDHLVAWIDQNVMPFEDFVTRLVQGVTLLVGVLGLAFNARLVANVAAAATAMTALGIATEDYFAKVKGEKNAGDILEKDSYAYQQTAGQMRGLAGMAEYTMGAFSTLFSTMMQSTTGFVLFESTMTLLTGLLAVVAVIVKIITGGFLIMDAAVQAVIGSLSIFMGLLFELFGMTKRGEYLVNRGMGFLNGAGQAVGNVGGLFSQNGPDFGGFVSRGSAKEILGPTAYDTLYGKNGYSTRPATVVNQTNTITVNTQGEAQSYAEIDKWIAANMRAKAEGGAP